MPLLELRAVRKSFGQTLACEDISLAVQRGEVLGLLGENGAGKTTLMNMVAGLLRPDAGSVVWDGRQYQSLSPRQAIETGIYMVHQHFSEVPTLTVAANVALGSRRRDLFYRPGRTAAEIRELAGRYRLAVNPDALVGDLSMGQRQRVEVLKGLHHRARLLILDEPTSVLSPPEVGELVGVLRALAGEGRSVIFISHKLDEVLSVTDRIAVLRRGRLRGVLQTGSTTRAELARLMVGDTADLELGYHRRETRKPATERPQVEVASVTVSEGGQALLRDIDLEVKPGRVLGIAGVEGNGQRELSEVLVGLRSPDRGAVRILGRDIRGLRPDQVASLGVGFIPEDRQQAGLIPSLTVAENLMLRRQVRSAVSCWGLIDRKAGAQLSQSLLDKLGAFAIGVDEPVWHLSGGNQQRVVVARELGGEPSVIVAAQPTLGLDVAATAYVHRVIEAHRRRGAAVVLISANLDELLAIADEIAVLYRGQIAGLVEGQSASRQQLGLMMGGGGAG